MVLGVEGPEMEMDNGYNNVTSVGMDTYTASTLIADSKSSCHNTVARRGKQKRLLRCIHRECSMIEHEQKQQGLFACAGIRLEGGFLLVRWVSCWCWIRLFVAL